MATKAAALKKSRKPAAPAKPAFNRRYAVEDGAGGWVPRVTVHKQNPGHSPRITVRCGCCAEKVVICFNDQSLEINGVSSSLRSWRKLLGPLLRGKMPKP